MLAKLLPSESGDVFLSGQSWNEYPPQEWRDVGQVEQLLAFGASPWEAVRDYARKAITAGMMPTINSLSVVGLFSLPGMMTGQILAGMNPASAVHIHFSLPYRTSIT